MKKLKPLPRDPINALVIMDIHKNNRAQFMSRFINAK